MIIYSICSICGNDFTECRELKMGESVVFGCLPADRQGEDIICDECIHDGRKQIDVYVDQVSGNDEWMNYYSNDYMEY